jgi:LysR family transcriptional regulator, regulatory protein for tcuABC
MELRQLRMFVKVVELGSISRAAQELAVVQSAVSQQISRLEGGLSTRLLQRSPLGVTPTEAGVAFYREAQLTLRHADQAVRAAQQARLTGSVSVGLAPTTASVLGLPLIRAMRQRYPDVRLHLVEALSGHLSAMLNARDLDLAVLFDARQGAQPGAPSRRWHVTALLEEDLFLITRRTPETGGEGGDVSLAALAAAPLILPTGSHGLRSTLDAAFAHAQLTPHVVMEVDSLALLMDAVDADMGGTVQPWSATGRFTDAASRFVMHRISDAGLKRVNSLCTLPDDELSPVALAARVVLLDCVRELIRAGDWTGARFIAP